MKAESDDLIHWQKNGEKLKGEFQISEGQGNEGANGNQCRA